MAFAPLRLNCPNCRRALTYIRSTDEDIRIYRCSVHGEWDLSEVCIRQHTTLKRIRMLERHVNSEINCSNVTPGKVPRVSSVFS